MSNVIDLSALPDDWKVASVGDGRAIAGCDEALDYIFTIKSGHDSLVREVNDLRPDRAVLNRVFDMLASGKGLPDGSDTYADRATGALAMLNFHFKIHGND